jgi:hypothetical protein
MGEGKTSFFIAGAAVAVVALAVAGIVYVRVRPASPPAIEAGPSESAEETVATSSGQDRVADVLNADDYLDEALNDLDAVNY